MKKVIIRVIAFVLIAIQFIRPTANKSEAAQPNDICNTGVVPDDIALILHKACYDCHSNNTNYLWYTHIQPIGWWINHHIEEGKDELNFSEFGSYKLKRKIKKYNEIASEVTEGEMPLNSYLVMHKEAKLSKEEANKLINWANLMATKLEKDSLLVAR